MSFPSNDATSSVPRSPAPSEPKAAPISASGKAVVRNAFLNWLGVGVEALVAILFTPFLIRALGNSAYGTWIVIGSLTGYLGVLDFGLRGSVGRHVALYRARGDTSGLASILSTALAALSLIGVASFCIVALLAMFLDSLVRVPEALMGDARTALLIVGVHLSCWFVLRTFDATLWGYQRFDLLNMVDIPAALLRGIVSVTVVSLGFGLVGLACTTLTLTLSVGLAKFLLCRRVDRALILRRSQVRWSALKELGGYGFWNFLVSIGTMARTQLSPTLVGAMLGVAMVTPFSIIVRLLNTAALLVSAATGVLMPIATAFYAQGDRLRQQQLFIKSGKFCAAAALYFGGLFFILGESLLTIWIGPDLAWAWRALTILAAGELVPLAVSMSENTILGMARNRPLAYRGIVECLSALGLAVLLGRQYGLNGVCAALGLSAACWRGAFMLIQALRLLEVPFSRYVRQCIFPVFAAAIVPMALLALVVRHTAPTDWPTLCAYTACFSAIYFPSVIVASLGFAEARAQFRKYRQLLQWEAA